MSHSRTRSWPRRTLALLIGALAALVATEAILQALALAQQRSRAGAREPAFVVCQGDSNTFGLYLASASSYPAQLGALLAQRHPQLAPRVVNRGVPGKASWNVAAEVPGDLELYAPRLVLAWIGMNDRNSLRPAEVAALAPDSGPAFEWRLPKLARLWSRRLDAPASSVAAAESHQPSAADLKRIDARTSELEFTDRAGRLNSIQMLTGLPDARDVEQWIRADAASVVAAARARGADAWLVAYPLRHAPFDEINAAIENAARACGATLVDARADFASAEALVPRSALFFGDGHPTELGYAILARRIARMLEERGVLPRGAEQGELDVLAPVRAWSAPSFTCVARAGAAGPRIELGYASGHHAIVLYSDSAAELTVRPEGGLDVALAAPGEVGRSVPLGLDAVVRWSFESGATRARELGADGKLVLDVPRLPAALEARGGRAYPRYACVLVVAPGPLVLAQSERIELDAAR